MPRQKPKLSPKSSVYSGVVEGDKAQKGASSPSFLSPSTMASLTSCSCCCSYASQLLRHPKSPFPPFPSSTFSPFTVFSKRTTLLLAAAKKDSDSVPVVTKESTNSKANKVGEEEEFVEVEEELPWYQEKALDLVEFTGSVTQAIPGPRVGQSSLPWILAVPLAYLGVTFVIAFVKTVRKFNSPKEKRRRQVTKNAILCKSVDELLEKGRDEVKPEALAEIVQKTGFSVDEILRKYIRYALNEKPFNPELVANLIQLRKASALEDTQVAKILNEVSRRIERDKGPVVMNMSGYTEKGFKRKLAVQALFGKIFYLSELPEFCSKDSSLTVKEIFGVTDEDAEKLRIHTLSEVGDMDSLQKMADISDSEDLKDDSSDEGND